MDFSFLSQFAVPVIVGICLCAGYVVKTSLDFIPNKYIPLIMAVLGLLLNLGANHWAVSLDIILSGVFSGLASTGLYEAFRNMLQR